MKHLDITFVLETCSDAPDAAPMCLAAVAWDRFAAGQRPFLSEEFKVGIDLRSCVMKGFDFSMETVLWWSRQSAEAQESVAGEECYPIDMAFRLFCDWIKDVRAKYTVGSVCLWCQGSDFDIPVLKHVANRFGLHMPIDRNGFRDCRTYIIEAAQMLADTGRIPSVSPDRDVTADAILADPQRAFLMAPPFEEQGTKCDPVYNAKRSTWAVWHLMSLIKHSML